MANVTTACRNCGHVHPSTTSKNTTIIADACDQCNCKAFRHGARAAPSHGQLRSDDTPGHALALENATLKEHVKQLRERVPATDASFTADEVKALRNDAATAHAELTRTKMSYAQRRRELERLNIQLAQSINDANTLAQQLRTIAEQGYSSYTHPAVVNGIKQLNDTLTGALALSQAQG